MKRPGLLLLLVFGAVAALAEGPPPNLPKPEPGMGMYVMVVWANGTPAPDGSTLKNMHEPDVAKIGGRVLYKSESRRIITIPLAAAKGLRHDPAVVYLQRLWMGESLAGWDERYTSESSFRPSASTSADTDIVWGPKDYAYDGSGNIKSIGADQYVYDSAGRLIQSTVSGKTESFKYDSFGNLIEKQVNGAYTETIAVDGASNRLIGVQYDAAGNAMTVDNSSRWYLFDSLSALAYVEQPPALERRILYDASDERIGMMSGTLSRWTIRDFAGHMIREFKGDGTSTYWIWDEDNFYGEGSLLAGETQEWGYTGTFRHDGPRHYHLDHLGSVRVVTNSLGRSISEHDYDPFGTNMTAIYQEPINWNDPHIDSMRFAGHSRDFLGMLNVDNTDYIDYMHARHYDPNLGRFLSVDPGLDVERAMAEPQLWNRYTYALSNPIRYVDSDGNSPLEFHKSITFAIKKYVYNFDWTHAGLHIDITLKKSKWTKWRVGKGLRALPGEVDAPKEALKLLRKNSSKFGSKVEAALAELLDEGAAAGATKIIGKLLPIAGLLVTFAVADKANADDDRAAINEWIAQGYYHKGIVTEDEITKFWREHDSHYFPCDVKTDKTCK